MLDHNQFEQLFRLHYEDCMRYAFSFMKNNADAEEVVQEVFLKLWQKKDDITIQTSHKAYLLTSIRNKAYEYHRKKISSPNILSDDYFPATLSVYELKFENKELETAMHQAMNSLPEKCQQVFLLSRQQQLTYKQIAEKLDISVKTVENHIGKALKLVYAGVKHLLPIVFYVSGIGELVFFFIYN